MAKFALSSQAGLYTEPSARTQVFQHIECNQDLCPTETHGVYLCPKCRKVGYLVRPLPSNR